MRPVLLGDVVSAARVLLAVAPADRPRRLEALMSAADTAEHHWQWAGRSHPRYGDGSLMTAALASGTVQEPSLDDADYCRCLVLVLSALAARAELRR
jgi:hypothetical protein